MFDYLRDRGSTAEDRQREALSAYLDDALTAAERERLESQLARDSALRSELDQMRLLKAEMRAMPRRRVPRNFTLDPALYGRPKAQPMMQLYPVLRGATALTAFLLIFTLALGAFRGGSLDGLAPQPAAVSDTMVAEEQVESFDAAEAATANEALRPMATVVAEMESTGEQPIEPAAPESAAGITSLPEDSFDLENRDLTAEATLMAEESAAADIAPAEPPAETITEGQAGGTAADMAEPSADQTETAGGSNFALLLGPIQIGLAAAFLILFVLWLIARRRVRDYR